MEQKDYYQTLGVDKSSTPQQIKDAYRKLAFEYHPDKNKDNPQAAARMKEINESYAVLSDPQKRRQYDALRRTYGSSAYGQFRQNYSEQDIFKGSDIHQIFEELSKTFGFRGFHDIFRETYGPVYKSFEFRRPGISGRISVSFSGWGGSRNRSQLRGPMGGLRGLSMNSMMGLGTTRKGKDIQDMITISPELAKMGGKIRYFCRKNKKELIVKVPPGIRAGQQIRLRGMGGPGKGGGEPGNLYVRVRIRRPFAQKIKGFLTGLLPQKSSK